MGSNESDCFHGLVKRLAYELWENRGRASSSPEQDWFQAERVLRHHLDSASSNGLAFPSLSAVSPEPREECWSGS